MATVETCTSWPMTTVPVRSLMTTRAGASGTTKSSPISARKRVALIDFGLVRAMLRMSRSRATVLPKRLRA